MLKALLPLAAFACSVQAGCIGVEGQHITASDLSKAEHKFADLDPTLVFSYSPELGSRRIVAAADIDRWAIDHGLENPHSTDTCFERITRSLDVHEVSRAIEQLLGPGLEDFRIDVIDVCQCKVPPGRLEFTISGASLPPAGHPDVPVLWRGHVIGSGDSKYPIWIRVRVRASINVIRATTNLRARQILTKRDLEDIKVTASPLWFRERQGIAAYEGKIMNVSLVQGSILRPDLVHPPSDIERGSLVKVAVVNGPAHLTLEARAEIAGNTGQTIILSNPAGAARFQAHVIGPGRAEIVLSPDGFAAESAGAQGSQAANTPAGRTF